MLQTWFIWKLKHPNRANFAKIRKEDLKTKWNDLENCFISSFNHHIVQIELTTNIPCNKIFIDCWSSLIISSWLVWYWPNNYLLIITHKHVWNIVSCETRITSTFAPLYQFHKLNSFFSLTKKGPFKEHYSTCSLIQGFSFTSWGPNIKSWKIYINAYSLLIPMCCCLIFNVYKP